MARASIPSNKIKHNDYCHHPSQINYVNNNHSIASLRFSDQIFGIFLDLKTTQLPIDVLWRNLHQRFQQKNIDIRKIDKLSFVQILKNDMIQLHLRLDDVCPNGAVCKLSNDCNRIHFITAHHICTNDINYKIFRCYNSECNRLFHVWPQRMRDIILAIILFIYQHRALRRKQLSSYYITRRQFIATFFKFYRYPPMPYMDIIEDGWKKMINSYNKYYFDRKQQQHSETASDSDSYLLLWTTQDFPPTFTEKWRITIHFNADFFAKRTCYRQLTCHKTRKCNFGFERFTFCPYFHLNHNIVAANGHCWHCINREKCVKYHIDSNKLSHSINLIGNCFLRSYDEITNELVDIRRNHENSRYVMELNDFELVQHGKWCNILYDIRNQHILRNGECKLQKPHSGYHDHADDAMDGGFHAFNERMKVVTIKWDLHKMSHAINAMPLISKIKNIFNNLNETPMDIVINGIEKHIVLSCTIFKYQLFAYKFKHIFQTIPRKWCYNRRVSIAIKTLINTYNSGNDTIELMVEVQNVNTFCDVNMVKEWFYTLILKYSENRKIPYPNIAELIQFNEGSFHFVQYHSQNADTATIYFRNCQLQSAAFNSLPNVNINGAPITAQFFIPSMAEIRHSRIKFINYKEVIICDMLDRENKLYLHFKQQQIIQNAKNNINISVADNNKPNKRCSPPPPPPPLRLRIALPLNDNDSDDEYDYSDESEEGMFGRNRSIEDVYNNGTDPEMSRDIFNILETRHELIGNLNGKNQRFGDVIDKICRYCLLFDWSQTHIFECFCIPDFVRQQYVHQTKYNRSN